MKSLVKKENDRVKTSPNLDVDHCFDPPRTKDGKVRKRDPVDPAKCTFVCQSCAKGDMKLPINCMLEKSTAVFQPLQQSST